MNTAFFPLSVFFPILTASLHFFLFPFPSVPHFLSVLTHQSLLSHKTKSFLAQFGILQTLPSSGSAPADIVLGEGRSLI